MKPIFSFSGLDEKQKQGLFELLPQLTLDVGTDGIRVKVKAGTENSMAKSKSGIELTYVQRHDFYRLLSMLERFSRIGNRNYVEQSDFEMLCYLADMSGNAVFNLSSAKDMIRFLALAGYHSMMLYTEDTYEIPEYPYFGYQRGRFTEKELVELDDYCDIFGIELIPCIQTLGHLGSVLQWDAFETVKDTSAVLNVASAETYRLIDAMLNVCKRCFRSKKIHIGMNDAQTVGLGKCSGQNGSRPKGDLFFEHLTKVCKMCEEKGLSPMAWSDMFFRLQFGGEYYVKEGFVDASILNAIPNNLTVVYWDYYTKANKMTLFRHMISAHKRFNNPVVFAGGTSKWYGPAPKNEASIETACAQLNVCREEDVKSVIVTGWSDNGAESSQFSALPVILYYAESAYSEDPPDSWLESRSMECFGISFSDFLKVDVPNYVKKQSDAYETVCPAKYLLFNDPLLGLMDCNVDSETVAAAYRENAKTLYPMTLHPHWGYLFATLYSLCDLLSMKADLSIRIREAYLKNDRAALTFIADQEIPMIVRKLGVYTDAFRDQWYYENKTFGFEIQEDRLGGLRQRLISAAKRLHLYLDSEIPRIEELEAERLPFAKGTDPLNPYITYTNGYFAASPAKLFS